MLRLAGSNLVKSRWPHELFITLRVKADGSMILHDPPPREIMDLMAWCMTNLDTGQDAWRLNWLDRSGSSQESWHYLLLGTSHMDDHVLAYMTWGGL